MRRYIETGEGLPAWTAPISHAVVVDHFCFLSGQLSLGPDGVFLPGSIREEAARAFTNLFAAARAAGFEPGELAYIDLAFIDLADVAEVNALWAELFPAGRRPARTIYQAAALPYGARIKVQGIAVRERGIDDR